MLELEMQRGVVFNIQRIFDSRWPGDPDQRVSEGMPAPLLVVS